MPRKVAPDAAVEVKTPITLLAGQLHQLRGPELARVYAWKTYDEERWFEMCVVPRAAIIPVNRTDGPFARNEARH